MCPAASEASQATNELDVPVSPVGVQGENLRSCLEPTFISSYLHGSATIRPLRDHIDPGSSLWILNSGETIPLVRGPSLQYEVPPRRVPLLSWLQLSGTISAIHRFSYVVRSSPHSKRYNAPISMWVVMNSGRYLCVTIPTIKRRDLSGYEKITTCKSYRYRDPEFLRPQLQL